MSDVLDSLKPGRSRWIGLGAAAAIAAVGLLVIHASGPWVHTTDTQAVSEAYRKSIQRIDVALRRIQVEDNLATNVRWVVTSDRSAAESETVVPVVPTNPGGLRLTGIAWNPDRPLAFVNGQVVGVGESVNGWTLREILTDRVRAEDAQGKSVEIMVDQL